MEKMTYKDVINRISFYRTKRNLSARELSILIGKNECYINRLECSMFNLPTKVLLDIIYALEITPEEFFSNDYLNYEKNKELSALILKSNPDKMKLLIDMIKKKA